jgi:hypothetical protein
MIVVQYLHFDLVMNTILIFYRNFVWLANFISLFGCYLIVVSGSWLFVTVVFWVKISTNFILGLYTHIFHPDQFYFFNNLGYSKPKLYALTFMFDMTLWMILSLLTIKLLL